MTSKYKSDVPARDSYVTLAEYFKNKHYNTAAVLSHHHLAGEKPNLHHGFDHFDSDITLDHHKMTNRRAVSITEDAIDWIKQKKGEPFFMWLVYFDPHDPYTAPNPYKGYYNKNEKYSGDRRKEGIRDKVPQKAWITEEHKEFLINAYDEEIKYFDFQLGELINYLKAEGLYDNTMIIITADHGEELGDNGHRWDHCQLLSQEEIWVPLLVKMPGQKHKRTYDAAVQNIDIFPTAVDYLDDNPNRHITRMLEGTTLMPLIDGQPGSEERYAVSFWKKQQCIIYKDMKYYIYKGEKTFTNIKTGESLEESSILRDMKANLSRVRKTIRHNKRYYREIDERLKSLGYLV